MRSRKAVLLALFGLLAGGIATAQEKRTERTFKLGPGAKPPAATNAAMAWLAGHWTGEALGGVSEEIWSPLRAGSMMGMYRLVKDGKPVNADLTGWEEKGKTVDFPLVALGKDAVHFEGMSFHPRGRGAATVYLAIHGKDGRVREEAFSYSRVVP